MTIKVDQKPQVVLYAPKVEIVIPFDTKTTKDGVDAHKFFDVAMKDVEEVKATQAIEYVTKLSESIWEEFDVPKMIYLPKDMNEKDGYFQLLGYDMIVKEDGDHSEFAESESGEILIMITKNWKENRDEANI